MFDQRVIVITGATGGLGKVAARAFAEGGASLALLSTDQGKLDALARDLNQPSERILTHAANLLDPDAVQGAAEAVSAKFGGIDALIHLVGGWTGGKTLSESSPEDLKSMLDQHTWSTYYLARAFLPALRDNGWGRILAVSSPFATQPSGKMGPYAAGKAAQETLLLTLADEFKGTSLTANVIQVKSIDVKGEGKGTSPTEIVAALFYLLSDEAVKVNGARIPLY
jgi:NAD(P)-dependent dehydrogenase (short-subunit alcohol dehydrogenase family)